MDRAAYVALQNGIEHWKAYREGKQNITFENADISHFKMDAYDLSNCNFEQATLIGVSLVGATLNKVPLKGANLVQANLTKVHAEDTDFSNVNFKQATFVDATFIRCTFVGVSFTVNLKGCVFDSCKFKNCSLASLTVEDTSFKGSHFDTLNADGLKGKNVTFEAARIQTSRFEDSKFTDSTFRGATIEGTTLVRLEAVSTNPDEPSISFGGARLLGNILLSKATMPRVNFQSSFSESMNLFEATLPGADFSKATLHNCSIGRASLINSNFTDCDAKGISGSDTQFQESDFRNVNFSGGRLTGCKFMKSNLQGSDLTDCHLMGANLEGVDLRGAVFVDTKLAGAKVKGARITRFDFDDIRIHHYWGLRESQLRGMLIEDDFAKARMHFSGFRSWYHSIVTVAWLVPLIWIVIRSFVLSVLPKAVMDITTTSVSLGSQLWGYIVSGEMAPKASAGTQSWDYPFSAFHFITFTLMLLFNAVRMYMLFTVKNNELTHEATGLQPAYADAGVYRWLFRVVRYGAYVYSLFSLYHVVGFLRQEFPVFIK